MKVTFSNRREFSRDAWCLFGLPVDNLTMDSAQALLHEKISTGQRAVLSTVNINWIVQSLKDPGFRNAILTSDIITIDGRPLLWLAKLLGLPMTELVPGSTLIDTLQIKGKRSEPLSLFLFGGEAGIAQKAFDKVNAKRGGLYAVGALNPGFGTIQEMSRAHIVDQINKKEPDILLVALGAKKGTQWIEVNRNRLNAKVISHLGATINFLAESVRRAPAIIRSFGCEWAWRIFQEPKLFGRYLKDGLFIIKWVVVHILPWVHLINQKWIFSKMVADNTVIKYETEDVITLCFGIKLEAKNDYSLRRLFGQCASEGKNIVFDFKKTKIVDGSFLGICLLTMIDQFNARRRFSIINMNSNLKKLFRLYGMIDSMQGLGFEI